MESPLNISKEAFLSRIVLSTVHTEFLGTYGVPLNLVFDQRRKKTTKYHNLILNESKKLERRVFVEKNRQDIVKSALQKYYDQANAKKVKLIIRAKKEISYELLKVNLFYKLL